MHDQQGFQRIRWLSARTGVALVAFLAIAVFFLATEHTAHFVSVLPYAFLLACPLIHLWMHGGHAGHAAHSEPGRQTADRAKGASGEQA